MIPPHDLEAEKAVISSVLLDGRVLDQVRAILPDGEAFYSDSHRRIYEAAIAVKEAGSPVDIQTVASYLRDRDRLQAMGGILYLTKIVDATPSVAHVPAYASIVLEKWRVRQLIDTCRMIAGKGYSDYGDAQSFIEESEQKIFEIARKGAKARSDVWLYEVIEEEHANLMAVRSGERPATGIPFGLDGLDNRLFGMREGELTVIGGRPGQGKTALATCIAMNVAEGRFDGVLRGVDLSSLEMTSAQEARRAIQARSRVAYRDLCRASKTPESSAEFQRYMEAANTLHKLPIRIDDMGRQTVAHIRARFRRLCSEFDKDGQRMSLIVSDYLQRMGNDSSRRERRNEVADNVAAFADMLKEFRVHGILLSQVNRDTANESRRPRMSDLAESGVIEQAAHNIVLVHRPEYYCQDKENVPANIAGLAELIIDKARDGQPGIAQAKYVAEHTAFVNPTISDLERWAA